MIKGNTYILKIADLISRDYKLLGFHPSCRTFSCNGYFPTEHLSWFLLQLYQSRAGSVFILHGIPKESASGKNILITDAY